MKILYFTRDYTTHDRRFLAALSGTGHQFFYMQLERRGHSLEDRPLPPQVEMVHWQGGQRPYERRMLPGLVRDFRRVVRQLQPDLVHAGPVQTSALIAALSGFRPLVSMSWGSDMLVDAERGRWNRWATRLVLRRSAALVGDCRPVREKALSFGMPNERIVTFPWGIDLEQFTRQPYPPPAAGATAPTGASAMQARSFTLLSTRGWEPIYGVEVIARAFVLAAGEHPELRLILLSNGSQAGMLRQIFMQGGVTDRVFIPGQINQDELPRLYGMADLYVAASHSDGTSISLLEALACGRPVLVSDIPGNREWITPGVQGWLFPDGDAAALAQGIRRALAERAALVEMGQHARALAEQRADWKKNFPQLFNAYRLAKPDIHFQPGVHSPLNSIP